MTSIPCIDVILLSWNRVSMTIETVQNLLEQQGVDLKIWIVDQGSKSEELEHLKQFTSSYSNIHIEALDKNVGVPGGRNIGTWLGQAPYTVSIDNDAVFESPFAFKQVVEIFDKNPRIGVISFRIKNFYTGLDDELSWVYPKSLKSQRDQSFLATRFVGCGHAIRRDVFDKAGGYDDSLFFCWEEIELSHRIINLGYELLYSSQVNVLHKVAPEARVRWKDKRFYFHVRNAIYTDYKYNQSIFRLFTLTMGYLIKGCSNCILLPTLKGVFDSYKMCFSIGPNIERYKLNENAINYIREHETRHRGNLFDRLRNEAVSQLPKSS